MSFVPGYILAYTCIQASKEEEEVKVLNEERKVLYEKVRDSYAVTALDGIRPQVSFSLKYVQLFVLAHTVFSLNFSK
jgi:hypothetical protein